MRRPIPTFDIEGIDAAHKLAILSSIAFGVPINIDAVYTEGISRLAKEDIKYAEQLGYRIKLLAITKRTAQVSSCGFIQRWCRCSD